MMVGFCTHAAYELHESAPFRARFQLEILWNYQAAWVGGWGTCIERVSDDTETGERGGSKRYKRNLYGLGWKANN